MATALGPFPDIEQLVISLLSELDVEDLEVSTDTPPDPQGTYSWLPFIRIDCFGGGDDRVTDTSRVTVDAFAATKEASQQLAEQARQLLIAFPHQTEHGVLDHTVTNTKPNQVPYGDETKIVRYTAAYTVTARRS
jgi:hypothetical protein